jgi:hypothetical protein
MDHRLKTPEGKKLYALRKQTPEPGFPTKPVCAACGGWTFIC